MYHQAGDRSYARGVEYAKNGAVREIWERDGVLNATVRGNHAYRVKLWNGNGRLYWSCTCPHAADGFFCKHCVAAGLEWLKSRQQGEKVSDKPGKPAVTMNDVSAYLSGCVKEDLVKMLIDHAESDERLRKRLFLKTAKERASGVNMHMYRAAIDRAVDTGDFVSYSDAFDYTQGIADITDSIEELLKEGYGAEVIELSEHALSGIENHMGMVDDSDGNMGDIIERLQEIHFQACLMVKPDPETLAKHLFECEIQSEYEIFSGVVERYSKILGETGIAVYRELAEREWSKLPELKPGRFVPDEYGNRFRMQCIMESLARLSGNIEELVAVKTRNLSHAYSYLEIAEIYNKANLSDKALEWAEKGLKAFPERTDSRLRDFLAGEYHRRKRFDEEMAVVWANFTDFSQLDNYRKLKEHASRLQEWPAWREKALEWIKKKVAVKKQPVQDTHWSLQVQRDQSLLVEIFLWEKDVDSAWLEAKKGGCSNALWLELAERRSENNPEDALPVYMRHVEHTVGQKNNNAYREAVRYIHRIHELMHRLGRKEQFIQYLSSVRAAHKPKRNFMKLLDEEKWT